MDILIPVYDRIREIPHNFEGDAALSFLNESADVLVYFCVLYILLVFVVPEHVMKNRNPLNLRIPFILWNLSLCIFSILGAIPSLRLMLFLLKDRGFYQSTCTFDYKVTYNGEYAFWIFYFILSKIPEMMDTVFLVLQKKPVIFLHWYHHLTVAIFCWQAGHALLPSGLWFATMNYCVHSIMYFYYFVCACGFRKVIRPIAPFITSLQILQMVAGTFIVVYTAYHSYLSGYGCNADRTSIRMGLVMYASYFVLFAVLFYNLYLNKNKKAVTARNNAAVKANGQKKD
ncbi:putative fatty acid elongase [Trypanosoma theileri]|uniref:Elongation of fatty acids protein n=1 Tax=Trypanosoma theileri TaxID=67003 RepID=A0A1X0NNK7_9TRYP|nr:putative fatty acid elongase [Trypanosoma theileri]ORC86302.1 putative fatty acid elongase [Trypanosoma theileri]